MKNIFKTHSKHFKVLGLGLLMMPATLFAAGPPKATELYNPLAIVLLVVIIGLLLAIALLANVVITAAKVNLQRFVDEKKRNGTAAKAFSLIFCLVLSTALFAQGNVVAAAQPAVADTIAGLSSTAFYSLLTVVFLELLILYVLLYNMKLLLKNEAVALKGVEATTEADEPTESAFMTWWDNFNSFKPMKEEASIDLGHDYDGIRELDNRLPPWWIYGFYLTIIIACIYLYRYHVAHSAPLSREELAISLKEAEADKVEYLKHAANSVDETNVKLLTSADDLADGKKIFTTICMACHRPDGGGSVGPNLTDDYWLHGGGIKDIFKTIKYGYPEKGMKSWKDDYTPGQIAQLASYVKSIHGTNPPNPKAPQGVLYVEEAKADSTKTVAPVKADSTVKVK